MKKRQITPPRRKPCLAIAALALGCGLGTAAQAEDWKVTGEFGWLGVGKPYQVEKGHVYWVGEFSGTLAADKGQSSPLDQTGWKCPGFNDFDFNNKKSRAAGYCVIGDVGGDQAYFSWQCEGDTQICHGTFDYTGGTGKFQGISGHGTFVGHIQVNWPDGTASGYSTINR